MKQLRHILYVLTAVTLSTACQDEYEVAESTSSEQAVRVTGSLTDSADTRLAYTVGESSVSCAWAAGDTIALMSSSQTAPLLYVAKTSGTTTEFEALGEGISVNEGDTVYAWAPYQSSAGNSYPNVCLPNIRSQYYNGGEIPADLDFVYASGQVSDGELHFGFNHLFAFLHLRIAADWLSDYMGAYIYGGTSYSSDKVAYFDGATYDMAADTIAARGASILYYIDSEDVSANKVIDCYVAIRPMPADSYPFEFSKLKSDSPLTVASMSKKSVPDTGFLAGHVYTTAIGSVLEVSPTETSVDMAGGTFTVGVVANDDYSASTSADWLTLTSDTDCTLTFTASANTGTSRTATITITSGDLTETVTVTQEGITLTVSPTTVSVGVSGGTFTVMATSNATYSTSISGSWLSLTSDNNGTLTFTAAANTSSSSRTATITITSGDLTKTVTVTQEAVTLTVSPTTVSVGIDGGTFTVAVNTNTTYNVSSSADWLSLTSDASGTLTFTATANSTGSSRTATITITAGSLTRTVKVTQSGKAATDVTGSEGGISDMPIEEL